MMISQDGVLDRGSVAVVVPAYNRAQFTPDEEISFRHLEHVLGRYDKFLAVPRSLEIERPGYQIQRFDDGYFGSAIANGKLMLSPAFYESFRKYRYILIYQLDALVFSDQLLEWCRQPLGGDAACRKRRVVSPKSLEFSARALVGTILDSS